MTRKRLLERRTIRVSIDTSPPFHLRLANLAVAMDCSQKEVIRRGIAFMEELHRHQKSGARLHIVGPNQEKVGELVLL